MEVKLKVVHKCVAQQHECAYETQAAGDGETAGERIFEKLSEDFREAGLFVLVDYVVPGNPAVKRTAMEWAGTSGLLTLVLGYIMERRRKP